MARETAYSDEDRRRIEEEQRWQDRERLRQDWERRRWEMAKGYAEGEYERGEPRSRYGQHRGAEWSMPGPFRGRGPKGYRRNDEAIREDVCERLMEHGQIDAGGMEVEVSQGMVILRGFVNSRYAKREAESVADSVPGVRDVQNELRVRESPEGQETRGASAAAYTGSGIQEREQEQRTESYRKPDRPRGEVGGANLSVFAIFRDRPAVEQAVDALRAAGFRNTDISVLFPDNRGTKDFAFEKGTKAPEGAVAGAGSGAVVGGVLGWLAGIGVLAVPGIGPFIAAGPIVAALAGMGIAGTIGGLAGALIGMGIPEYEAKRYEGRVKGGHILLSVHCDDRDWADRAEKILGRTGGEDIARGGEKSADFAETDKPLPRGSEYRQD